MVRPDLRGNEKEEEGEEREEGRGWSSSPEERFDQIVNTAFSIKSHHSSLIQVADAVSYIYRRHLELKSGKEAWAGEKAYIDSLAGKLEPKRELLGRTSGGPCVDFYESVRHEEWRL